MLVLLIALVLIHRGEGQFAGCDTSRTLRTGETYYIQSPNYGNYYKANTNCRWRLTGPTGYQLYLNCYDVVMTDSTNCAIDRIEVSLAGNAQLAGATRHCGTTTFVQQTTSNKLTMALRTSKTSPGGRFRCQVVPRHPTCDCGRRRVVKIVNGVPTLTNEFPMMAGLVSVASRRVFCGATIISNRHAITAAHCLAGRKITDTVLLVGDHDLSTGSDSPYAMLMPISTFTRHSGYREATKVNDIALVRTRDVIVFNRGVGPACLPWRSPTATFSGSIVEALGWGMLDFGAPASSVLQKVSLVAIANDQCRAQMAGVSRDQLCTFASGKDTCQQDSGGPLLYTDPGNGLVYHVGVISYGIACASGSPSVNTRITSYLTWIKANTAGIKYCEM